jgi:hypothetical protein
MRKLYTKNRCYYCKREMVQPKKGRTRKYCSDACKQRYYRAQRRQKEGRARRTPTTRKHGLYERKFPADRTPTLKYRLSPYSALYECQMCGDLFERDTLHGGTASRFCSDACRRRANDQWEKVINAYYLSESIGRRKWEVFERIGDGYLSPICPQCGIALPPGKKPGRKRVYCSDQCRKQAYEDRYQAEKRRKRKHRYGKCRNCGERFDRHRADGKLQRVFCSFKCGDAYRTRRKYRIDAGLPLRGKLRYRGGSKGTIQG